MYAVITTGGKQYRVQEGAVVRVEKLDADQGASIEFNQVLLVGAGSSVTIGAPYVGTAKVVATVESHGKGEKVRIVKFRRRKHYKREKTHRQPEAGGTGSETVESRCRDALSTRGRAVA